MSESSSNSDFLLLFRGSMANRGLSPEQMQQVVADWAAWFEGLLQSGKALAGHPLEREGVVVSGKQGRVVADGPFAESKEAIAGYFHLRVGSLEEAVKIAQQCPGLEYGSEVEVRPVAESCTLRAKAATRAT
jgi:hypothetical protein